MLNATVLTEYVSAHPGELDAVVAKEAELLKKIHSTHFSHSILPPMKDRITREVRSGLADLFDEKALSEFEKAIAGMPDADTMIHGDFQMRNIMIDKAGKLVLIDLGFACIGHPIFDLASMMPLTRVLHGIATEREIAAVNGISSEEEFLQVQQMNALAYRAWRKMLSIYFDETEEENLDNIEQRILVYSYALYLCAFSVILRGQREPLIRLTLKSLYDRFYDRRDEIGSLSEWWKV